MTCGAGRDHVRALDFELAPQLAAHRVEAGIVRGTHRSISTSGMNGTQREAGNCGRRNCDQETNAARDHARLLVRRRRALPDHARFETRHPRRKRVLVPSESSDLNGLMLGKAKLYCSDLVSASQD